jgi:K+-sensing histidine kinase KdpD
MKKKLLALICALALVFSLVGCTISAPDTVGSIGDFEITSGMYLLAQSEEEKEYIAKEREIIAKIQEQIEFTREYQDLGTKAAQWQDLNSVIARAAEQAGAGNVKVHNDVPAVEVFADPMLERVFFNLFDNAIRHGNSVTEITVRCEREPDGMIVIVPDHNSKGVEKGTYYSILRQAGLK